MFPISSLSNDECPIMTLREKCPYSELFWSVFSRIRTEYGAQYGNFLRIMIHCTKICVSFWLFHNN